MMQTASAWAAPRRTIPAEARFANVSTSVNREKYEYRHVRGWFSAPLAGSTSATTTVLTSAHTRLRKGSSAPHCQATGHLLLSAMLGISCPCAHLLHPCSDCYNHSSRGCCPAFSIGHEPINIYGKYSFTLAEPTNKEHFFPCTSRENMPTCE